MPHKRNPIASERVAGLARLLRGYAQAGLENVALWHERDISHSSVERVALPDATTLLHYMQHVMAGVIEGLSVHPDRMRANVELTHGALFSQSVLSALIESGMARDDAYRLVQRSAQRAWDEQRSFRELLESDEEVAGRLDAARLDALFDHDRFVRHAPAIIERLRTLDES
jgi:adenylosuccinate lyase